MLVDVHGDSDGFLAAAGMSSPVIEAPALGCIGSNGYLRAAVVVSIFGNNFSTP